MKRIRNFFKSEKGAAAVEYGLLVALIAVVILVAVSGIGTQLVIIFNKVVVALGGTAA